jgi:hypothetical protein
MSDWYCYVHVSPHLKQIDSDHLPHYPPSATLNDIQMHPAYLFKGSVSGFYSDIGLDVKYFD